MPEFQTNVSWSEDEIASTDKLNQMAQNDQVLFNMMPHFIYRLSTNTPRDFTESQSAVFKPTMIGGRISFTIAGRHGQTRSIAFPSGTFSAACKPVIMTQVAALGHERYVMSTISGLDGSRYPKSNGFRVQIYHRDGEKFQSNVTVHYLAFGYEEA